MSLGIELGWEYTDTWFRIKQGYSIQTKILLLRCIKLIVKSIKNISIILLVLVHTSITLYAFCWAWMEGRDNKTIDLTQIKCRHGSVSSHPGSCCEDSGIPEEGYCTTISWFAQVNWIRKAKVNCRCFGWWGKHEASGTASTASQGISHCFYALPSLHITDLTLSRIKELIDVQHKITLNQYF